MQTSKWIKDLGSDTAVEDAAWRVLTIRCDAVRELLDEALEDHDDPEVVHQLRVATRRAGAALWLFRDCVPGKPARKMKKVLSAIRREAGRVRDGDVMLDRLRKASRQLEKQDRPAVDFLIGYLTAQRLPAEEGLGESIAKYPSKLDRRSSSVVGSIKSLETGTSLGDLARQSLSSQLKKLDGAVSADSHDLANLHQARIIAKRLRYSMEIVAACYPQEFREELYPVVVELQEILGEIHDHDVSAALYRSLIETLPTTLKKRAKRYCSTLDRLVQHHHEAIENERPKYEAWRSAWPHHRAALAKMIEGVDGKASSNGSGTPCAASTSASQALPE